jgi:MSHA biogenesis protein MshK
VFKAAALVIVAIGWLACAAEAQELPLRDPMRPFVPDSGGGAGEAAPRGFELSAVFISATRRIAVINGDLVREGDRVGNAQITRIDSQSVRLRRGNEELVLRLNDGRAMPSNTDGDPAS